MPLVSRVRDLPPSVHAIGDGTAAPGPPGVLLHPGGPTSLFGMSGDASFATAGGRASLAARPAVHLPRALTPPAPDQALSLDASQLTRLLERSAARPGRWCAPAFVREVDLVRSHLRPIRTAAALAASFGREAFHGRAAPGSPRVLGDSAVRVAYAVRWLELSENGIRPPWRELIGT